MTSAARGFKRNRCKASPGAARGEARTSLFYSYRARLAALLTHSLWQNFLSLLVRLPGLCNRWSIDLSRYSIRCTRLGEQLFLSDMLIPPPIAVPVPNPGRAHFTVKHKMCARSVVKCLAFSVTGFGQICTRWRAVVVNYNKSTDCANMTEAVRLKCSGGVGYG